MPSMTDLPQKQNDTDSDKNENAKFDLNRIYQNCIINYNE
jgi:hypothetical protein